MNALGQYILSVTAAALISGLLCGLLETGFGKELLKLLCGLFLTLTVLKPISDIDFTAIQRTYQAERTAAAYTSAAGEKMAQDAIADIIKRETEAYILDKAAEWDAEISVEITIEHNLPIAAKLQGRISPYAKTQLGTVLEKELGITKENQRWT